MGPERTSPAGCLRPTLTIAGWFFIVMGLFAMLGGEIIGGAIFALPGVAALWLRRRVPRKTPRPSGQTGTERSDANVPASYQAGDVRSIRTTASAPGRRLRASGEHTPARLTGTPFQPWARCSLRAEVAGEFALPESFRKLFKGVRQLRTYEGAEMEHPAQLVADPANPYDPQAVAVYVAGHHVGYLERETAAEYHTVVADLAGQGLALQVPARIWASAPDHNRINARVTLWLPAADGCHPANPLPDAKHVILPEGGTIQVTKEDEHMEVLKRWLNPGAERHIAVVLRAIHEIRPRSSFEAVQVELDGERIGVLTATQSGNLLPLVKFVEARGLVPVAKAVLKGSPLKIDVVLYVAKSQDVDHEWLEALGPERRAPESSARREFEWDEPQGSSAERVRRQQSEQGES